MNPVMPLLFTALIFIVSYFYFVIWWWRGITRSEKNRFVSESQTKNYLSIIIAAHNEEKDIGSTLECLLQQDYPPAQYEIIVIADRCTDETVPIVQNFCMRFPQLRLLTVQQTPADYSPKKFALQQGIAAARFSNLILMDADVQTTPVYLQTFNNYFASGVEVLVNIPKFTPDRSIRSTYLLPERLITWSIAAAAVGHQKPFLAFGTTWGYTRRAYDLAGGLAPLAQSLSGDDDLLLARMQRTGLPVGICLQPAGWGQTRIPASWWEFILQRRRHHSAGKFYPPAVKMGYFCFHLSNLAVWLLPFLYFPAAFMLIAKFLADMLILRKCSQIFAESLSVNNFFVFEIGYLLHHLLIAPLSFVGKIQWR